MSIYSGKDNHSPSTEQLVSFKDRACQSPSIRFCYWQVESSAAAARSALGRKGASAAGPSIATTPSAVAPCAWISYTSPGLAKDGTGWHPPEKTPSPWMLKASSASVKPTDPQLCARSHEYSLCLITKCFQSCSVQSTHRSMLIADPFFLMQSEPSSALLEALLSGRIPFHRCPARPPPRGLW